MPSEEGILNEVAAPQPANKESPLTDIATSPPPFDFGSSMRGLGNDTSVKKKNGRSSLSERDSNSRANSGRKDSYESSELSDLGEDESEAETDKMDFLDDDDETSTDKISDLQALSKLTELARLKEVDSDDDDEHEEDEPPKKEQTPEEEIQKEEDTAEAAAETITETTNIVPTSPNASKRTSDEEIPLSIKKIKSDTSGDESSNASASVPEEIFEEKGEEAKRSNIKDMNNEIDSAHMENQNDDNDEDDEDINGDEEDNEREDEEDEDEEDEEGKFQEGNDVDMNEERKLAVEELISIERSFAELRDKLYQDKLNLLERELQLCLEGSHPELSKIYYKINGFYQDGVKLANSNLSYSLKCINAETIATRTSIHQNFLKNMMDFKNDMIADTTSLWYKINKERNQLDQLAPDYNFAAIPSIPNYTVAATQPEIMGSDAELIPLTRRAIKQNTLIKLVQQRNNVNHELGILNGLLEFHGFPSAMSLVEVDTVIPNASDLILRKATDEEINEDLAGMGIFT